MRPRPGRIAWRAAVAGTWHPGPRAGDEALPPDVERLFATRMGATTVEVPASHVAMVSHPGEVAEPIEAAAKAAEAAKADA